MAAENIISIYYKIHEKFRSGCYDEECPTVKGKDNVIHVRSLVRAHGSLSSAPASSNDTTESMSETGRKVHSFTGVPIEHDAIAKQEAAAKPFVEIYKRRIA